MDSPFYADRQYCVLLMMMTLGSMGMGVGCVGWGWDAVWPLSWVPEAVCGVLPSPGPELIWRLWISHQLSQHIRTDHS